MGRWGKDSFKESSLQTRPLGAALTAAAQAHGVIEEGLRQILFLGSSRMSAIDLKTIYGEAGQVSRVKTKISAFIVLVAASGGWIPEGLAPICDEIREQKEILKHGGEKAR